jgi:hypothetical protein
MKKKTRNARSNKNKWNSQVQLIITAAILSSAPVIEGVALN